MTPTGGDTTGAAIIALIILGGARLIDYLLPKGWHLRLVGKYAEKDTEEDSDGT